MADKESDQKGQKRDRPPTGPHRTMVGPMILAIVLVAGIIALFYMLTAYVGEEREPNRRSDSSAVIAAVPRA